MSGVPFREPSCGGCPLSDDAPRVVPKLRRAEILAIGEAPGEQEEREGVPFVGPAGRLIRTALEGLDVVYANVLQCRPPSNRTPTKEEVKACFPTVLGYIDAVQPRIILAIGAVALKALTGKAGILKLAGKLLKYNDIPVMPIIHPAWVLHGGDARRFDDCIKSLRAWLFPATVRYKTVSHGVQLSMLPWKPGPLGFDWETSDLRPNNGEILSWGLSDGEVNVVGYGEPDEDGWEFLRTHRLIAHSATFEHEWAKSRGHDIFLRDDTQVMAHLDDERLSTKLESVAIRLGVPIITYPDSNVKDYPPDKLAERNAIHAQATRQVYDILLPKMRTEKALYKQVLVPATETLAEIHLNGLKYSEERRVKALEDIERDSVEPMQVLCKALKTDEFNIKSAPQRVRLLFDVLKLPKLDGPFRTKEGGQSTNADVIRYFAKRYKKDKYRSQVLDSLLKLTTMAGWRTQFLEAFPRYADAEHFLRGRYHITGTVNSRLSTSEPNVQNMPREGPVRSCLVTRFGPGQGWLLTGDYKQIELMIFAAIARDGYMLRAFAEGVDLHRLTASVIHNKPEDEITDEERYLGKRMNFAMSTGVGPNTFAFQTGISDEDAKTYMGRFFDRFQGLAAHVHKFRHRVPAVLMSPTGRCRRLDTSDHIRAGNQALNFVPAEVALTVHLMAANAIAAHLRKYRTKSRLVSLIHDSLTIDTAADEWDDVSAAFTEAVEVPNDHPILKPIRDAGVTFRVDMKAGYSMGEQEEV